MTSLVLFPCCCSLPLSNTELRLDLAMKKLFGDDESIRLKSVGFGDKISTAKTNLFSAEIGKIRRWNW